MDPNTILYSALSLGLLGAFMAGVLVFAHNKLAVAPNQTVKKLEGALPSINCGACGFPGCAAYAEAISQGNVALNLCAPGGEEAIKQIASIVGAEVPELEKMISYARCQGDNSLATLKYKYHGIMECSQAEGMFDGPKVCVHGCLGLGSCYRACPFDAIRMTAKMLVKIDTVKCTGCGLCVNVCPRNILQLIPHRENPVVYQVGCMATESALNTRNQCQVGCIACGLCVKKCGHGAIVIKDNLAVIDYNKCVGCGDCEKVCPTKAINHVKKEKHHIHLI